MSDSNESINSELRALRLQRQSLSEAALTKKELSGAEKAALTGRVAFGSVGVEDEASDYGRKNISRKLEEEYSHEIVDEDDMDTALAGRDNHHLSRYAMPKGMMNEIPEDDSAGHADVFSISRQRKIAEREDEYHARRQKRVLSPNRSDPFAQGVTEESSQSRSYKEVMQESALEKEHADVLRRIQEKQKEKSKDTAEHDMTASTSRAEKKRRWDMSVERSDEGETDGKRKLVFSGTLSEWERPEEEEASRRTTQSRWDATPVSSASVQSDDEEATKQSVSSSRRRWDATPVVVQAHPPATGKSRWDATPVHDITPSRRSTSRWDATPVSLSGSGGIAVGSGQAGSATVRGPVGYMMTPSHSAASSLLPMTPEAQSLLRLEREMDSRNRPFADYELDSMLPGPDAGFLILEVPSSYIPIRTPSRKLVGTPAPMSVAATPLYYPPGSGPNAGMALEGLAQSSAMLGVGEGSMGVASDLPLMKPEDIQYFGPLLDTTIPEEDLDIEAIKERKILKLLLKIKNGTPPQRKSALRQITDKARDFGAGPLLDRLLPLLMSPSLEDQERHLLVKVIDRILYKLDDLVRPYVHKILVVIEPLLIDEDYYTRVEGREIISNLSKAAGLATMISTMRPDIDHVDEYVRNTTARAFSVVASALGIPALLPFLRAVCASQKSWQARHTGIKIVQQTAILLGCGVLPHLKGLVDCIACGLAEDPPVSSTANAASSVNNAKVRTITALALSALAEASAPYGIEAFDSVLKPLWKGVRHHRGKPLAAYLKAIGTLIPLMDVEYANTYSRDILPILLREFATPDEEMKKIVLKVVQQTAGTEGVSPSWLRDDLLPEFLRSFWVRRMALDRRNSKALVETTTILGARLGVLPIFSKLVLELKDESEVYRRMVLEAMDKLLTGVNGPSAAATFDERLVESLIDGLLFAFQEQSAAASVSDDQVTLNGFGTVFKALGPRIKPFLPQLASTILWRLNNKSARVRQQAADLVSRIAPVMVECAEDKLLGHLGLVLYEYLGEEYPETLGSLLGGLKAIVSNVGMGKMNPPIRDLLPRLTPILKNRHEKVQEQCIDLVGRIADRGAESVSAREWMRICFELLELLKAHKKAIRRAAINTFGYIAKAIGPQDVLATLLSNLKVQERQNRVCTTIAIAIVAETCSPFTVLPALMNEYRVPELNVQNGVLKSLAFLFEYIGELGKDYIYAVAPLLQDALMDRDLVHRQTACVVVRHMALGVVGLGCEDALLHLFNYVWPNIFETSPHVIQAVMEAVDACRLALGPGIVLQYLAQGLYHPARKVRDVYWKIYNNLYIGHQDALVAYYPTVDLEDGNYYRRELELIL